MSSNIHIHQVYFYDILFQHGLQNTTLIAYLFCETIRSRTDSPHHSFSMNAWTPWRQSVFIRINVEPSWSGWSEYKETIPDTYIVTKQKNNGPYWAICIYWPCDHVCDDTALLHHNDISEGTFVMPRGFCVLVLFYCFWLCLCDVFILYSTGRSILHRFVSCNGRKIYLFIDWLSVISF